MVQFFNKAPEWFANIPKAMYFQIWAYWRIIK